MVSVPSQYQPDITAAAQGTGIPASVVGAQAQEESGFNPAAVSSAGAEGFWQFLPSTYQGVAAQAGVPSNSEFNVGDETKAYVVYMNQLLQQEGGSIYKALEAYNAGPGNLSAGAGYANAIMQNAGVSTSATAGTPTQTAQTAGLTIGIPGLGNIGIPSPTSIGEDIISGLFGGLLNMLGLSTLKDLLQRLALILLGVLLLIVGIRVLSQGRSQQTFNIQTGSETETTPTRKRTSTTKSGGLRTGAVDAAEAAAVA